MRAWTTWPLPVLQGLYSFGKQVVEKVETEHALMENGRFVYHMLHSPMCKHLVNFFTSCGSCWSAMWWTASWRTSPSSRWWQSETPRNCCSAPPTFLRSSPVNRVPSTTFTAWLGTEGGPQEWLILRIPSSQEGPPAFLLLGVGCSLKTGLWVECAGTVRKEWILTLEPHRGVWKDRSLQSIRHGEQKCDNPWDTTGSVSWQAPSPFSVLDVWEGPSYTLACPSLLLSALPLPNLPLLTTSIPVAR